MKKNTDETDELEALTNQTMFGEEEPIFEDQAKPFAAAKAPVASTTPKKKSLIPLVLMGGSFLAIILGVLLFLMPSTKVIQNMITAGPDPTLQTSDQSAIGQRITELENDLHKADPVKLELPYPPVKDDIYIDQPQR